MNIADLRVEYKRAELDEEHADADPVAQFSLWWMRQALHRCAKLTR